MAIASPRFGYAGASTILRDLGSIALRVILAASLCLIGPIPRSANAIPAATGSSAESGFTRLQGHVVPALADSQSDDSGAPADAESATGMTLTFVLNRDDEAGFQRYLADLYNPASPAFRQFLTPSELAARFGPSQQAYDSVLAYLRSRNLELTEGSANRLTLLARGSRTDVEHAFAVHIDDYVFSGVHFFANDVDPALPNHLAPHVRAISGLSNLAIPVSLKKKYPALWSAFCGFPGTSIGVGAGVSGLFALVGFTGGILGIVGAFAALLWGIACYIDTTDWKAAWAQYNSWMRSFSSRQADSNGGGNAPQGFVRADGTGQTVGLLEFDTFDVNDVNDYLSYIGESPTRIGNLSQVHVGGGAAAGADQDEVLLDIDTVMSIAPGAQVVVYDAPFNGQAASYAAVFNAMINGGVSIISNSWASCEDQMSLADVQAIDSVLQTAAAAGIGVFNGAGDSGSTCLDGAANTIAVPADSPNATAVGGTTLIQGPGFTYAGETWWNGTSATPPTGQGGFGISRFFARPAYQDALNASPMRSIPDVAIDADPATGMVICQASDGGCPTGSLYGGTSLAAPEFAAYAALLNDANTRNLGAVNAQFYPLANQDAFHNASSMGSDFAHVGLGSPNVNVLRRMLAGESAGIPDAALSVVNPLGPAASLFTSTADPFNANVAADGVTPGGVLVLLVDTDGNSVSGKTVTLTANPGSHAVITPTSAVSDVNNGGVVFAVTDLTPEPLTFTATDVTDGIVLGATANVAFVTPPAASGGINAFPDTVTADGISTTTITVILADGLGRPTPGKEITIAQGDTRSVVVGPVPPVTDANGQIQFTATDQVNEVVTYTAVDVTDDDVPVPGSAVVTFTNSTGASCVVPPTKVAGYTLDPFANGFLAQNFFFGGVNWNGCPGASNPAFEPNGSVLVADFRSGDLFRLDAGGGTAASPIANLSPTLGQPTFGRDGSLYATHGATTGGFTTGDIVQIDPETGAVLRTVASNLTCPFGLSVDPLSGDLFFDDECSGAGSDNPSIFRVIDPANTDPGNPTSVVVYATLPSTPNGAMAFSPDGTLYVVTGYFNPPAPVYAISGTDGPQPPTVAPVPNLTANFWINVGAVNPNGSAKSLIALGGDDLLTLQVVDLTTNPYTYTPIAHGIGSGAIGPDGCLYSTGGDTIYKIAPESGSCEFSATNPSPALSLAPSSVSPNPAQGEALTLTATLTNVTAAAGTPVYFQVSGANAQSSMTPLDANGQASLTYTGTYAGSDTVAAMINVNGATLTSSHARVTWDAGLHSTFLSLANSPTGADIGKPLALAASLTDVSMSPYAAIASATIQFSIDGQTCSAITSATGAATCSVTLQHLGAFTLNASYAGSAQYLPASASEVVYSLDLIFADGFELAN